MAESPLVHIAEPTPAVTANTVLSAIGRTPLLRLATIPRDLPGVEIYAKAEWLNPGGSVKDRPALSMVRAGERKGALRPGKIILDATSGNTGIALAMIGAARGYRVRLCLPANARDEREKILAAYGADLVLTDPLEMTDGAIRKARALAAADPDRYFYADQYNNPANWQAHYETTAPEIWHQTGGRITHFTAGLGTGGTFVGTARRLIEFNPAVRLIEFQPDRPLHGIEGLKHMPSSLVPGIYDPTLADEKTPTRWSCDSPARKGSSSGSRRGRPWPRRSPWRGGFARASSSLSSPMAAGNIWAPASSGESQTNEITSQELKARLGRRDPVVLLDVRQDWETKLCRLENAVHIPIEEIEYRTEELNPEDEIVVYCHVGQRSAAVAEYLTQLGFKNATNLLGGLDYWAQTVDPTMRRY